MWKDVLWISAGAILGANLRYAVGRLALKHLSASVPYGTLIVRSGVDAEGTDAGNN